MRYFVRAPGNGPNENIDKEAKKSFPIILRWSF